MTSGWKKFLGFCLFFMVASLLKASHAYDRDWALSLNYKELFEGVDGGALYYQAGEKLSGDCLKTLKVSPKSFLKGASVAEGEKQLERFEYCVSILFNTGFSIILGEVHENEFKSIWAIQPKVWAKRIDKKCSIIAPTIKKGLTVKGEKSLCMAQQIDRSFGQLNIWYYQLTRSNPEAIYKTEYEWVWEMDFKPPPENEFCGISLETVNARQAPLTGAKQGKIVGKLTPGNLFSGQFYLGRQEGACQRWLYGRSGTLRGFVCYQLGGKSLLKPCP